MPATILLGLRLMLCLLPVGQGQPATMLPGHVRILCLDVSGSMGTPDGEKTRLQRAKEFALAVCRRTEMGSDAPVIVIFFRDRADARRYTSIDDIDSELSRLQAGGSTSIRSGLDEAARTLEGFNGSPSLEICLLTDGEDKDLEGIHSAQQSINKLLRSRHEKHLSSSVLVRSWSNDPGRLSEPLVAGGVAKLVDLAKPLRLRCQPRLALVGAPRWVGREERLQCTISCTVTAKGAPSTPRSLVVLESEALSRPLEVGLNGVGKEAAVEFRPGKSPSTTRLRFTVRMPPGEPLPGIGSMTFEGTNEVELEIPVPERRLANQLDVSFPGVALAGVFGDSVEVDLRADWKPRVGSASVPGKIGLLLGRECLQASLENGRASRVRLKLDPSGLQSGRLEIPVRLPPDSETIRVPIPHGEEAWSVRMPRQSLELAIPEPEVRLGLEAGAGVAAWVDPYRDRCRVEVPIRFSSEGDAWASPSKVSLEANGWEVVEGRSFDLVPNAAPTWGRIVLEGTASAEGPISIALIPVVREAYRNRMRMPESVKVALAPPPPLEVLIRPKNTEYRIPPWRRWVDIEYRLDKDLGDPGRGIWVLGPDGKPFPAGGTLTLRLDSGPMPTTAEESLELQPDFRVLGEPAPTAVRLVVEPVRLVREPVAYLVAGGLLVTVVAIGALVAAFRSLSREKHQAG